MNTFGFIRTAAAVPAIKLADTTYNAAETCRLIDKAAEQHISLLVFPELSLTGSTCGDLFAQEKLLKGAEAGVRKIIGHTKGKSITVIAGTPIRYIGRIYDCAVIIRNGELLGIVPKIYGTEGTLFSSGNDFLHPCKDSGYASDVTYAGQYCLISPAQLFTIGETTFAVELGEDLWSPMQPSAGHALAGAQIIANPSASAEILFRDRYRKDLLSQHSARTHTGYIHASAGFGESSTDMVYAGAASIWENGDCLAENERFSTESSLLTADIDTERISVLRSKDNIFKSIYPAEHKYLTTDLGDPAETDFEKDLIRHIEPHPFAPEGDLKYRCREILAIQTAGLARRLSHLQCNTAVLGISGGLDSTLALLVVVMAFDKLGWSRDRIVGVTMPGYGTTVRTKSNATDLMDAFGITSREISIVAACDRHFMDLGHDKNLHDVTYENSQARERTQILMDVANQTNGLVIGTGDLSELALGWATYNGDHMSMYGVNASIPKTLVRSLVKWAANNTFSDCTSATDRTVKDILLDIADTPISPELLPADDKGEIQQVTEDLVGPYELHDFFIYNFMRNGYAPEKIFFLARKAFAGSYDDDTIKKWLKTFIRRFFNQQFKRSCLPDGPAVGTVSLSPRGGWQMPSDSWSTMFSADL